MDLAWLNSLEFEKIPEPIRYNDTPRLSINSGGQMVMNLVFLRKAAGQRRFYGEVSKDGRCITLRPDDEQGQLLFTPKGVRANKRFSALLARRGIKFPVAYTLEWISERDFWVGCSGDLPAPPKAEELFAAKGGRKRRGV